jgi:hypothetical protein
MNPTLEESCKNFVAKLAEHNLTGKISTESDLTAFEDAFPGLLPSWYREVLSTYPIADICFETVVEGLPWTGEGHIRDAATLLPEIEGAYPDIDLAKVGYLVIGAGGDGDGWVIRSDSSASDPVHLLRMSDWGGGDPQVTKGCLLQHGASFADFLSKIQPTEQI